MTLVLGNIFWKFDLKAFLFFLLSMIIQLADIRKRDKTKQKLGLVDPKR